MMRKIWYWILCYSVCVYSLQAQTSVKVLQFNIWQEGTVVHGGAEAIVDEIIRSGADIVTLSEVRNYHNEPYYKKLLNALQSKGQTWYSFESYDSGILSKYPIQSHANVVPVKEDHGSIYKANIFVKNIPIAIYTAHLDYLNAANYLPRGYDGNTWKKRANGKVNSVDSVLLSNHASHREESIKTFIADAQQEIKNGAIVILGGDFNEPSYLDWTEKTKDLSDHNGLIVPWPTTHLLAQSRYIDSYRQINQDPVSAPGYTFPADNAQVALSKLVWAADADERDRIDFIFYQADKRIQCIAAHIIGPKGDIVKGERAFIPTNDSIVTPLEIWPTDHKAVLATFNIN